MSTVLLDPATLSKSCGDRNGIVEIEPKHNVSAAKTISLAALSKMAQFAAHDFRHHLAAVYSNAEFMCNRNYSQTEREELFAEIKMAIVCMTETLDSILLHSKTGHVFHLRLESLKLIVEQALRMVRSHPDADNVSLIWESSTCSEVCGDARWLRSAMFNLLLNACQASRHSPGLREVRVWCRHDQQYVSVRITDNGPGVPVAIQKKIFQPFVSSRQRNGMGLGLAIVERVARAHGGEAYLEDSMPGKTSFILKLPKPNANGPDRA